MGHGANARTHLGKFLVSRAGLLVMRVLKQARAIGLGRRLPRLANNSAIEPKHLKCPLPRRLRQGRKSCSTAQEGA